MKRVASIQPTPDKGQGKSLRDTLDRCNAACNEISKRGFEAGNTRQYDVRKLLYADIRRDLGLTALAAVRCIAKVADAYTTQKTNGRPGPSGRGWVTTMGVDRAMKIGRRQFLHLAAGAVALPAVSRIAWAQTYPTRSVTLVVPFAPGGTTDVVARIIGEYLSRRLGQQFVIENVAGAGGTTGTIRTMRANPDGYTIQIGQMGTHAAAVALYPDLAYKPDVDFEPIGMVAGLPIVITARKELPPDNLKEFILYVKANADKVNVAHAGVGSITHSTCLLLNSLLGVRPTFVPFTGAAPAMNALLGGQVDYMCNAIPDAVQQVQSGAVKGYAISIAQRSPTLPNVPTAKEAGLPEFQASAWNALFAPKGTPKSVLDKLTDALDGALDDEGVRKRLRELGCDIPDKGERGPQPLAALVKSEIARWTPILEAASIRAR